MTGFGIKTNAFYSQYQVKKNGKEKPDKKGDIKSHLKCGEAGQISGNVKKIKQEKAGGKFSRCKLPSAKSKYLNDVDRVSMSNQILRSSYSYRA